MALVVSALAYARRSTCVVTALRAYIVHNLDPIAFSLGPFEVRWYGLAYIVGFVAGGFLMYRIAQRWKLNLSADDVMSVATAIALGAIVGGRLGYTLFYSNGYYFSHPLEILALSQGGMSFHGGLIGAVIVGYLACVRSKLNWRTILDLGVIACPIGLCLGRIANFINGELWGKPTELPWGVIFPAAGTEPRHPSQLYEAFLEGVVLFCVLMWLARRVPARPQGSFAGTFLLLYGIFRFLIEFVRVPDAQLGYLLGGWLTMGQLLSLPLVVLGAVELVLAYKRGWPQRVSYEKHP